MAKDFKEVASWNGEPTGWNDYARQVRLCWEKTAKHKRKLLGPELASKLTGRAWAVTPNLDHQKLGKRNGTKYLLKYLQDRLCRTAIPDAGARLEDLLIRMRRPLGMAMSQWANEVLEGYRKVQRALIRARQLQRAKDKDEVKSISEPHQEPPTSPTRRTPSTSPAHRSTPSPSRRTAGYGADPQDPIQESGDERGDYAAVPQGLEDEEEHEDWEPRWTDAEWKEWRKQQKKEWYDDDSSSGEDLPWDELQVEEIQVLPDEVLGWLLLRRANLSASSRLSVQASVNNSLKFQDIELALRDQQEELLQADQSRGPHGKRRTYWVEEDGQWGLLAAMEDGDEVAEIHWVGPQLPAEVYDPGPGPSKDDEDDSILWTQEYDGWHGYYQDNYGFWFETDGYDTYWSADDGYADLDPEEVKELDEAYMAYENKARTFMQSRQLQKAKGASRGFYPLGMMKGKKGRSKGKYKMGHTSSSSSSSTMAKPLFAAQGPDGSSTTSSTGCFICGDKGHGFRQCPKRSNPSTSSFGKGAKKGTYWVESLTGSPLAFVGMVMKEEVIYDTTGYGVLDWSH